MLRWVSEEGCCCLTTWTPPLHGVGAGGERRIPPRSTRDQQETAPPPQHWGGPQSRTLYHGVSQPCLEFQGRRAVFGNRWHFLCPQGRYRIWPRRRSWPTYITLKVLKQWSFVKMAAQWKPTAKGDNSGKKKKKKKKKRKSLESDGSKPGNQDWWRWFCVVPIALKISRSTFWISKGLSCTNSFWRRVRRNEHVL